jgi:hypothetical protein
VNTQIITDFISAPEQQALLEWAQTATLKVRNKPDHLLTRPQNEGKQPTTGDRKSDFISDNGPPVFYEVQQRATERFGLEDRLPEHLNRIGKLIIHEEDSETPDHIDYFRHMGPGFTRATLIVQLPEEGGKLSVDGVELYLPERALAIYDASKSHSVSLVTKGRRIAYVFGWKDTAGTMDELIAARVREYGRHAV